MSAVAVSVFVFLFLVVTVLGFAAARWRRADLDSLDCCFLSERKRNQRQQPG